MRLEPEKEWYAPLYETLSKHAQSQPVSLHVPGHRNGESWRRGRQSGYDRYGLAHYENLMPLDVTELSHTDDLHAPEGVIAEAQQLAAKLYGSDHAFFLVGGSTAGNHGMILAVCNPGDLILVQRNVHKSVLNGLRLAGARAVFMQPAREEGEGTWTVPELQSVKQALEQYPQAKAVLLSTPNYYGRVVSMQAYADLIHAYQIPLLVDEAHGAHYGFHPAFPQSALAAGADAVVQSTHKTLTAMTMGAMLHIKGERINLERLKDVLASIQSSSPSYPIMASIDIARAMVQSEGPNMFESGLQAAHRLRMYLNQRSSRLVASAIREDGSTPLIDPLRVILKDREGAYSGYELQKHLEQHGCWAEMADETRVLLLFGSYMSDSELERILAACDAVAESLDRFIRTRGYEGKNTVAEPLSEASTAGAISEPIPFSFRGISADQAVTVNMNQAAGFRSAETVIPYPPGIPLLYAGEAISASVAQELRRLGELGAKCQGATDPTLQTIRVIQVETNG
ncbi:aminotransferase class I/II-fold pyridoxal phosphate-dependent enzyme [Paenibacillus sp. MMS18-CY102]|uniref:aminotransferase class I/II-fold pyridoxal phosphate-dependent enzyme n=1 Tax=Paenibacillus sp. MMS18-CY102 TaxID=2682849 RepID=UPI001365A8A2|nr:aminotransferase class I/II-fold pyridoxal phosphate-dependent enzyme [Paenibacillus sp. MMS18-CY102]MWC31149.1 aminotransferase class I/II-fold pyridoxal phosphate-dependent enzyme [Paenibacillus sp. MMS18-CY102]